MAVRVPRGERHARVSRRTAVCVSRVSTARASGRLMRVTLVPGADRAGRTTETTPASCSTAKVATPRPGCLLDLVLDCHPLISACQLSKYSASQPGSGSTPNGMGLSGTRAHRPLAQGRCSLPAKAARTDAPDLRPRCLPAADRTVAHSGGSGVALARHAVTFCDRGRRLAEDVWRWGRNGASQSGESAEVRSQRAGVRR